MGFWADVIDNPDLSNTRTVSIVDFIDGSYRLGKNDIGAGRLRVPAGYDRILEVLDPENGGGLVRLLRDGVYEYSFFAQNVRRSMLDDSTDSWEITGPGIESVMDWAIVYPYDNPANPSIEADWVFGSDDNLLSNPGFEDIDNIIENAGGEDGELSPWSARGGADVAVVDDVANAYEGTHYFTVNPSAVHDGIQQTIDVEPNTRYTVTVRIKSSAIGRRYTLAATLESGGVVHQGHLYKGEVLGEIGGAAYNGGCPGGSADNTWQLTTVEFTTGPSQTSCRIAAQYDHHSFCTTGSTTTFWVDDFTITGATDGVLVWEPHGSLNVWRRESTPPAGADGAALQWKGTVASDDTDGFFQTVENLVIGANYSFQIKVRHNEGSDKDFRLVFKRPEGTWLASVVATVPTGTWTTIGPLTAVVDTEELDVGVRWSEATNPVDVLYADEAQMWQGFGEATVGDIMAQLMVDAVARGTLDFLYYDFTALLDSDGGSWSYQHQLRITRGMSYRQVLDLFAGLGYEWRVDWNDTQSKFELLLYDINSMGTSGTPTAWFRPGMNVENGWVKMGAMPVTHAFVEGDEGLYSEFTNTLLRSRWGRREAYKPAGDLMGDQTLLSAAQDMITKAADRMWAIRARIKGHPIPRTDFDLGDQVYASSETMPKKTVRVAGWQATFTQEVDEVVYDVEFSSPVYDEPTGGTTSAGTSVALNKLLRKFEGIGGSGRLGGGAGANEIFGDVNGELPGPVQVIGWRGRQLEAGAPAQGNGYFWSVEDQVWSLGRVDVDVRVAASDAPDEIKSAADFVCTGTDDQVELQAAADLATILGGIIGARVLLSSGTFHVSQLGNNYPVWVMPGVSFVGQGARATRIVLDKTEATSSRAIFNLWTGNIRDIWFDGSQMTSGSTSNVSWIFIQGNFDDQSTVQDCRFQGGAGHAIEDHGYNTVVERCTADLFAEYGDSSGRSFYYGSGQYTRILNNHLEEYQYGAPMIDHIGDYATIDDNYIITAWSSGNFDENHAIRLYRPWATKVTRNHIDSAYGDGIRVDDHGGQILIADNNINQTYRNWDGERLTVAPIMEDIGWAIRFEDPYDSIIANNYIYSCDGGMYLGSPGYFAFTNPVVVADNTFNLIADIALVQLRGSGADAGWHITGNNFVDCDHTTIILRALVESTIEGNTFTNCAYRDSNTPAIGTQWAIWAQYLQKCSIKNNSFHDTSYGSNNDQTDPPWYSGTIYVRYGIFNEIAGNRILPDGGGGMIAVAESEETKIVNNVLDYCGIVVYDTRDEWFYDGHGTIIQNNIIRAPSYGTALDGVLDWSDFAITVARASRSVIKDNVIGQFGTNGQGIHIIESDNVQVLSNVFRRGNYASKTLNVGIKIDLNSGYTYLAFNTGLDNADTPYIDLSPSTIWGIQGEEFALENPAHGDAIVWDDALGLWVPKPIGKNTAAEGVATIADTSSTVSVTHGLPGTPEVVLVSGDGNETLWITSIGATTFTVNRAGTSGARKVYWRASSQVVTRQVGRAVEFETAKPLAIDEVEVVVTAAAETETAKVVGATGQTISVVAVSETETAEPVASGWVVVGTATETESAIGVAVT